MAYTVTRDETITQILQMLADRHCVSIVGLSNMGKSMLLRSMREPSVAARYTKMTGNPAIFLYIDCNSMIELTGQGLYEAILRSAQETLADRAPDLVEQIASYYRRIVEPDSHFLVPLSFNTALTALIEEGQHNLILMLDEFDDPFDALDGRVFLNLRALKDKYPDNLMYITASVRRLGAKRSDEATAEFVELSAAQTIALKPLNYEESLELIRGLLDHTDGGSLPSEDCDMIWRQTGGHPRLLRAVVSHLVELRTLEPEGYAENTHQLVMDEIINDPTIRAECTRIWGQIGPEEREALQAVAAGSSISNGNLRKIMDWGLVTEGDSPAVFGQLMYDFVIRQSAVQQDIPGGIWVDHDSGDVWIEGVPAAALTELEFKLLALLFDRTNKLTDKYQIVETVWGVDYIDEVDDARIEKLVSRLRAKVEPDPSDPRYIVTIRGRGYKLTS